MWVVVMSLLIGDLGQRNMVFTFSILLLLSIFVVDLLEASQCTSCAQVHMFLEGRVQELHCWSHALLCDCCLSSISLSGFG